MYPIRRMWNKYYRTVVTWPRHFYSHLIFFSASISSQICFPLHINTGSLLLINPSFRPHKPITMESITSRLSYLPVSITYSCIRGWFAFMHEAPPGLDNSLTCDWSLTWSLFFFYLSSSFLVLPTDLVLSDSVPSPVRCNLASTTWSLSATFLTTSDSVNLLAGARLSRVSTSTWATFPPTTRLFSVCCLFTVSSQTFCCCLSLFLLLVVCTVLAASRAMTSTWALRPLRARSYTPVCWLWLFHLGSLRHQSLQFCG